MLFFMVSHGFDILLCLILVEDCGPFIQDTRYPVPSLVIIPRFFKQEELSDCYIYGQARDASDFGN